MIRVEIDKKANKFVDDLAKTNKEANVKIANFLSETLPNYSGDPRFMPNAKHLKGYKDNRYRWRIGQYRIIGLVTKQEIFIVSVIKIDKRDDKTYKR